MTRVTADPYYNLMGAIEDLKAGTNDAAVQRTLDRVLGQVADMKKTIKNIVAVGYDFGTPAHRMLKMLDIAEKADLELFSVREAEDDQVGGIPA